MNPDSSSLSVANRRGAVAADGWIALNAVAMGAALTHTLIDFHLGEYGTPSSSMSPQQGANVVMTCVVVAVYASALALGTVGSRPALTISLVLAIGWVFLGNGAAIRLGRPRLHPPGSVGGPDGGPHLRRRAHGRRRHRLGRPHHWLHRDREAARGHRAADQRVLSALLVTVAVVSAGVFTPAALFAAFLAWFGIAQIAMGVHDTVKSATKGAP